MNIFLFTLSLLAPLMLQAAAEEPQLNLSGLTITESIKTEEIQYPPSSYHGLSTGNICKNIILQRHGCKKARKEIENTERTRIVEKTDGQEERSAIPLAISDVPKGMANFLCSEKGDKTFLAVSFGTWREDGNAPPGFDATGMRRINNANFDTIRGLAFEYAILGQNNAYGFSYRDNKPITEPASDSAAQDRLNLMRQTYKELKKKTAVMYLQRTSIYAVHHCDIDDWTNLQSVVMPADTPQECRSYTERQMRIRGVSVVYGDFSKEQLEELHVDQEEKAIGPMTRGAHWSNLHFETLKKEAEAVLARDPRHLHLQ